MNTTPYLQQLSESEPWRLGLGQPRNALDPTWSPSMRDTYCSEDIEWEGATGWWICQNCGYIGSTCFTRHRPVYSPLGHFLRGVDFYLQKKAVTAQTHPGLVIQQLLFIAGTALRSAAVQPHLGGFARKVETE